MVNKLWIASDVGSQGHRKSEQPTKDRAFFKNFGQNPDIGHTSDRFFWKIRTTDKHRIYSRVRRMRLSAVSPHLYPCPRPWCPCHGLKFVTLVVPDGTESTLGKNSLKNSEQKTPILSEFWRYFYHRAKIDSTIPSGEVKISKIDIPRSLVFQIQQLTDLEIQKLTDLESTSKLRLLNWSQLATFCKLMHLFDAKGQNSGSQKPILNDFWYLMDPNRLRGKIQ